MTENFEYILEPNKVQKIKKGWGSRLGDHDIGEIYAYHSPDEKNIHKLHVETVKLLFLNKNKKLSLHFHHTKDEIFMVAQGSVMVETIEKNGKKRAWTLKTGDRIFVPKCTPHRLTGTGDNNLVIEVSTLHRDEDSFRIEKGD